MAKAGRGDDQYMVRFPEGLRNRIKEKAEENGRSMNTEIIERLEWNLMFDHEHYGRLVTEHEELERAHFELNKKHAALEKERDDLKIELAGAKAALAEQKAISAQLQHLIHMRAEEARQDQSIEDIITEKFNELKAQADYLEGLKAELIEASKEREVLNADAAKIIQEQRELIEKQHMGQKANVELIRTLQKVFRKAADGDDDDLKKMINAFQALDERDE